jgi:hypothetical protein
MAPPASARRSRRCPRRWTSPATTRWSHPGAGRRRRTLEREATCWRAARAAVFRAARAAIGDVCVPVGAAGLDGARPWQSITQPLPTLRVSFSDRRRQHSRAARDADRLVRRARLWAARAGASMRGADVLIVALKPDGTPVVRDSYALSDQLRRRPTSRSTAAARVVRRARRAH